MHKYIPSICFKLIVFLISLICFSSCSKNNKYEFSIYPNPFDTYLFAKSKFNATSEILVFDIYGKILLRRNFMNEIQLPTTFLNSGIYFYEVRYKNRNIQYGNIIKTK